ncbi:pirin family protein [Nocardioides sp. YIM 152315]|uniref:pirin family protein n=1 Tax=Nocardioides sp. YIM 152315 TaxID=3031760 RepID=UPI0023DCBE45|nr:pirin family protein [Nocardioides sp. YIM 152315]MDF1604358.1 pirin family protein [Nocardioides sp. YIM 152315]
MSVEIRRGTDRFLTRNEGVVTRHSFSFGGHYDPENVRFGRLVCHDDHLLAHGRGFGDHPHRDVDIVTWVLGGELHHDDSAGHRGVVRPGEVQVLSAGAGVTHSEVAGPHGPTRFVQAWLTPTSDGAEPAYSVTPVSLAPGALTEVARLGDAVFSVARLGEGDEVRLPDAPLVHAYVAGGALTRSSLAEPLADGDAFRITDVSGVAVTAAVPTELLVWSFV